MKPKLACHIITCHTSRIAVGTKTGLILIVEEADVITQIHLDANDPRATRVHHSEKYTIHRIHYFVFNHLIFIIKI